MRWDVIRSFGIRAGISASLAAVAYMTANVSDVANADQSAIIVAVLTFVGHFFDSLNKKYGKPTEA